MTEPNVTARYVQWDQVEVETLSPLLSRQLVVGTNLMAARIELKQGAVVPLHRHHNEQISHVLKGALHFVIDGAPLVLHAGELLCIPPDMPHEARALEDTVALDIFNPPRQDWLNKEDAYLRHDPAVKS